LFAGESASDCEREKKRGKLIREEKGEELEVGEEKGIQ
jgi:hypothetical protein